MSPTKIGDAYMARALSEADEERIQTLERQIRVLRENVAKMEAQLEALRAAKYG